EISMGGAVTAVTVRNDLFIRFDAASIVHAAQLVGSFEEAFVIEVVGPFQMDGAGYRAPSRRSDKLAGVFAVRPSVDNQGARFADRTQDIIDGGKQFPALFHFEITSLGYDRLVS